VPRSAVTKLTPGAATQAVVVDVVQSICVTVMKDRRRGTADLERLASAAGRRRANPAISTARPGRSVGRRWLRVEFHFVDDETVLTCCSAASTDHQMSSTTVVAVGRTSERRSNSISEAYQSPEIITYRQTASKTTHCVRLNILVQACKRMAYSAAPPSSTSYQRTFFNARL